MKNYFQVPPPPPLFEAPKPLVWQHRMNPGPEVLAIFGQPGIGGAVPFIHGNMVAKTVDRDGEPIPRDNPTLRKDRIFERVGELAAAIRNAGVVKATQEWFLPEPANRWFYDRLARYLRDVVDQLVGPGIQTGIWRIPNQQPEHRFHFAAAMKHTTAVFVPIKGTDRRARRRNPGFRYWHDFAADVRDAVDKWAQARGYAHHVYVYRDAISRNPPYAPFPEDELVAWCELVYGTFEGWGRLPDLVFRQAGTPVRDAMLFCRDWIARNL